ncbi:MAG: ribosome biogenesis GTPase YlqF [Clostridia bacterium]|nr:ribosome biogenesis GTPase YlqF [Clostridia bacterium]
MKKNDIKNDKNNNDKSFAKVRLNWFPGHMAKTRREIEESLKLIDVVVEILDARIPLSSQNPEIAKITKGKKKVIILNKIDLADEKQNQKWVKYFEKQNIPVCLVDANSGKGIEQSIKQIEKIMQQDLENLATKGRIGRKIRVMIVGIPNVGKSSYINRIAKKVTAGVGNKPGVTKQKQWIRINDKVELLDTPGVLWPKFESQEVALNLAFTGTIKEDVLERVEIAYHLVKFLLENYRQNLCEKYKLDNSYIEEILNRDLPENENIYEIMLEIGRKRGCIVSGGNIDDEKTAKIILDEFKNGKLGRITIETCF